MSKSEQASTHRIATEHEVPCRLCKDMAEIAVLGGDLNVCNVDPENPFATSPTMTCNIPRVVDA